MEMTEIRKESVTQVQAVDEVLISLASTAQEVLGYKVLAAHSSKSVTAELTALQSALISLDIEILNHADVLAYQKERMIEQTAANIANWVKETKELTRIRSYHGFSGPSWHSQKISEYAQPVPEFVLAKAVQIKQAIPECEIYVESLQSNPDPFLVVGIPDGRAYYDDKERYYVEVWAEPKFEGRV